MHPKSVVDGRTYLQARGSEVPYDALPLQIYGLTPEGRPCSLLTPSYPSPNITPLSTRLLPGQKGGQRMVGLMEWIHD